MLPYIIKSDSLSLFPFGQAPIVIAGDHINFNAVVDALKSGDYDLAIELASVSSYLNTTTGGDVSVDDSGVYYKGNLLNDYLARKLHTFFTEGLPVQHYCLFINNLMANPSMVSRKELFLFLEAANLPITEDGCFLAYKAVRSDYKDIHSGKFDNSPGVTHTMPRAEVDDDRNQTCSYGFHASAYEYAKGFMQGNGHLVAVKINPADVVSVPATTTTRSSAPASILSCSRSKVPRISSKAKTTTAVESLAIRKIPIPICTVASTKATTVTTIMMRREIGFPNSNP